MDCDAIFVDWPLVVAPKHPTNHNCRRKSQMKKKSFPVSLSRLVRKIVGCIWNVSCYKGTVVSVPSRILYAIATFILPGINSTGSLVPGTLFPFGSVCLAINIAICAKAIDQEPTLHTEIQTEKNSELGKTNNLER